MHSNQMKRNDRLCSLLLSIFVTLTACATGSQLPTQTQPMPAESAGPAAQAAFAISPLPGGLDQTLVLHSNNPERIESAGVLISTRTQPGDAFLSQSLQGDFALFLHHIARTPVLSGEQIYLGLVASLPAGVQSESVDLELLRGNAFLTRPDAPFIELAPVQANPTGTIFAGPGDRLALADLQQQSSLIPQHWQVTDPLLLYSWQVPTNPLLLVQQDNALSGLLHFRSQQAIDLSLVAIKASRPPTQAEYLALLQQGQRAGPVGDPATVYDPQDPPPGGGAFRYGRVAGLVQGRQWQGQMRLSPSQISQLQGGTTLGWPVASLYLKRYDSGQSQSAPVIKRLPGAAIESQGNYGLHYRLQLELPASEKARRYRLSLTQPQSVKAGQPEFLSRPASQVTFRGSIQVTEQKAVPKVTTTHLVLHSGERPAPFWEQNLAAGESRSFVIEWVYPPDATPPQLLLLESETL